MMRSLCLSAACLVCLGLVACTSSHPSTTPRQTFSSFDSPAGPAAQKQFAAGTLRFEQAELAQVLAFYQQVSGRTVIRSSSLPPVKISVQNQTVLNRIEILQLLDTVLAEAGIAMVLHGDAAVKAVPAREAGTESAPAIDLPAAALPNSSSYMTRTVRLKNLQPNKAAQALQPLSRMPNSIVAIGEGKLIILRDYAANIRQMLELLEQMENQANP